MPPGGSARSRLRRLLALSALLAALWATVAAAEGPQPAFRVFDDGVAPMAAEYARYGGAAVLGPPVSRRFSWDGFLVQAFQKGALQWRPELGMALPVNVLDELARRGKDDYLASLGVPRHEPPKDEAQALSRLDVVPELKAYVLSFPDWKVRFGLPTGVGLRSDFQVVRFQRAVLQRWLIKTPFANPGDITLANVGDMLKEAGLIPKEALEPEGDAPDGPGWLARLNHYRQLLGLAPAVEDPALSAGAAAHARYMVATQTVEHREDPQSPYYTPEGDRAARNGNVAASTHPLSPEAAVDGWMNSTHALLILNPALKRAGFGSHYDPNAPGPYRAAATLDVLSGRDDPGPVNLPITWHIRWAGATYWFGGACAATGGAGGPWTLTIHREGQTVTAPAVSRDGTPLPADTFGGRLGYRLAYTFVAACLPDGKAPPGRYRFEFNLDGRPNTVEFDLPATDPRRP